MENLFHTLNILKLYKLKDEFSLLLKIHNFFYNFQIETHSMDLYEIGKLIGTGYHSFLI